MTNTDIVARLIERANRNYGTSAVAVWNPLLREAAKEIKTLRAERDDARALFCGLLEAYKRGDGREEAKKRGWFCFKEDTND